MMIATPDVQGAPSADEDGLVEKQLFAYAEDLSKTQARLERQAFFEPISGTPNMSWLEHHELEMLGGQNEPVTVFAVTLASLGQVNDLLGVEAGDALVKATADALQEHLSSGEKLVWISGHMFAVFLPGCDDSAAAQARAHELAAALERHALTVDGIPMDVEPRIGVAVASGEPRGGIWSCVRQAEEARLVTEQTRSPVVVYGEDCVAATQHRIVLNALRRALDTDGLTLNYQPKIRLEDMSVRGVEALLRWNDPELGFVSPATFIPLAERTRLINELTCWVLRRAFSDAAAWRKAGHPLGVSVNVSARDLLMPGLAEFILAEAEHAGIDPVQVTLEVTETSLMEGLDCVTEVLGTLTAAGMNVSIDDFGTGYSSLAYLGRLPVQEVKLDRAFVMELAEARAADLAIVDASIALTHGLDKTLTAEGIEDVTSLAMLRDAGCDLAQGFFIARPMPADALLEWVVEEAPRFAEETLRAVAAIPCKGAA